MNKIVTNLDSADEGGNEKQTLVVESVSRSMDILICLAHGKSSIKDIADDCGLTASTAYRLLQTLEASSAVMQDPISHRYYLGSLIPSLVQDPNTTHQRLILCAAEDMHKLAKFTQETVTLTVYFALKHLLLSSIPSSQRLRVVDPGEPGDSEDLYLAAKGKVLLSQLTLPALKATLKHIRVNSTQNPLWTVDQILKEIEVVRKKGFAVTTGIRVSGATCISVPVANYGFPVCLSILGPENRLKPRLKEYLQMAIQAASAISQKVRNINSLQNSEAEQS